ncbi:MAG: APA family basic amino acid/polyamine antiporter, partial [Myxococcota bacterium]
MNRLDKDLGLWDVFAISTGAMISSGFFLLPGLAYLAGGPAVVIAYVIAGLLIIPAMLAVAELSTALPRSGGAYFFLDRALGPLTGTIGGLGTWLALIFKTAFALIGGGAYLSLILDVPVAPVAIGLAVCFLILNIVGAKETAMLQRVLVAGLIAVLGVLLVGSGFALASSGVNLTSQFLPLAPNGWESVAATIGLVFVSYMGLTKVASVAEEVKDPGRNIPLGMGLSLAVTTVVYMLGVFALVALV